MLKIRCALAAALTLLAASAFAVPQNFTITAPAGALGFGKAIAVGDLDGDKYLDLAVGAPDGAGGAVYVYYGTATGFSATPGWSYQIPASEGSLMGSGLSIRNVNPVYYDGWEPDPVTGLPIPIVVEDGYNDIALMVKDSSGELMPYAILGSAAGLVTPSGGLPDALVPDTVIVSQATLNLDLDGDDYGDGIYGDAVLGRVSVRYADTPDVNDPPYWLGAEVSVKPEDGAGAPVATLQAFDPDNRGAANSVEYYVFPSAANPFTIDKDTGVLRIETPSLIPHSTVSETWKVIFTVRVYDTSAEKLYTDNLVTATVLNEKSDEGEFIGPCFLGALGF